MTPAFRIEIRIRNNRLIRARERLGYGSAAAAAKALHLKYPVLVNYESMATSPLTVGGDWKPTAQTVSDALFAAPEDLWPDEALTITRTRASFEATYEQLTRSLGSEPERRLLAAADAAELDAAMQTLTAREADVVERTVAGGEELTQLARRYGVSRARLGQIRESALGKLRAELRPKPPRWLLLSAQVQTRCERCAAPYDPTTFRSYEPRRGEFHYLCGKCWREKFGFLG